MKRTIILGAGPAGLSAALELAASGYEVTIIEKDGKIGGISKTVEFKGQLFDLGPHRFFTKNAEVSKIWHDTLGKDFIEVPRLTRIFYDKKFFKYPIELKDTIKNAGILTSIVCLASYFRYKLFPVKPEESFADWITNRFGRKLFLMFFKSYTEKVWGISTDELSADWAAQRIKGLSLWEAVRNAVVKPKVKAKSLIEKFNFPRLGAGMMYEKMAANAVANGAKILTKTKVVNFKTQGDKIVAVVVENTKGEQRNIEADQVISTLPLTQTIEFLGQTQDEYAKIKNKLKFRNHTTVNFIINKPSLFPDNWIYVHDADVKLARIPNYRNFSKDMVRGKNKSLIACEYFCFDSDFYWTGGDKEIIAFATDELIDLDIISKDDVEDAFVSRIANAYPMYSGKYLEGLSEAKAVLAKYRNLQVAGRGGMFRYNNMDHSVLSGLYAAKNVMGENHDIWEVNAEDDYHEQETKK